MKSEEQKLEKSTGYFDLVRNNSNFRNLWAGQIVSLLGDWFNLIASASLIAVLTNSGLAVGGLFIVRMLAPFFISPIAGVAADRYNRKWILILTDLLRAAIVLLFLVVRKPEHIWLLYTLTALQLALGGVFFPTRNAILPDIVSHNELGAANALSSSTWSVMLAFGAAIGGLAAGKWGIYPAFVIDCFTFLISAAFIAKLNYTPPKALQDQTRSIRMAFSQYADGIRYIRANKPVLIVVFRKGIMAFSIAGAFQVLQVHIANDLFPIGAGGGISLGLMYAVVGIGTGIGPILLRFFTGDRINQLRIAINYAYLIAAAGVLIVSPLQFFPVVLIGIFLRGFGTGVNWVFSTQVLFQIVPNEIRGRVFSTEFAIFSLLSATASMLGGMAIDSPSWTDKDIMMTMAVSALVFGVVWAILDSYFNREESSKVPI